MRTLYDASMKGTYENGNIKLPLWADKIAKSQGHNLAALVMKDQSALMQEELISGYMNVAVAIPNQVVDDKNARLTDLGIAFCKNIEMYRVETPLGHGTRPTAEQTAQGI